METSTEIHLRPNIPLQLTLADDRKSREVFISYLYMGSFHRRAGWRTKDQTVTFRIPKLFEMRQVDAEIIGIQPDIARFKAAYKLSMRFQKRRFSLPFHAVPLITPIRLRAGSKLAVEIRGTPFKLANRLTIWFQILGVKVYKTKRRAS